MRTVETPHISFLQFENLADQKMLRHGVSLRVNRKGRECHFSSRPTPQAGESTLHFCNALELPTDPVVCSIQVHGNRVAVVTKPGQAVGAADGLCTNRSDIALMLLGADCPLLLVYDPVTPAVGLAHAGWRGTVQHIAVHLVETMETAFGCRPENMQAGIGPGICNRCYLVGEEVMLIALLNIPSAAGLFRPGPTESPDGPERWYFDLIEANRRELLGTGIPAGHIKASGYCTYERADLFPSYRREGRQAGRWALMAGLA